MVKEAVSAAESAISLAGLFAQVAARYPDLLALIDGATTLTYAEVVIEARRTADRLRDQGVRAGMLVGLVVQRDHTVPISILAILQLGAAYVPLDPSYPAERLIFLIEDSALTLVVGDLATLPAPVLAHLARRTEKGLPDSTSKSPSVPTRDDLAYVIYTSGSTGAPKGCLVTHGNVLSLLAGSLSLLEVGPEDRWSQFHSASFDVSVYELWAAWASGAAAVVVPQLVAPAPALFLTLLREQGVTVLSMVPSVFHHLAAEHAASGAPALALRYVLFAGESVQLDVVEDFAGRFVNPPAMVNLYGITEITVHATFKMLGPEDYAASCPSPIGRELPHLRIVLRDAELREVPDGEEGEIWVHGKGVTLGYLRREEMTRERFMTVDGDQVGDVGYRSGDMARRRPDGQLDYLGRRDQQVKLNGFRIELDEIEAVLRSHHGIEQAAVLVVGSAMQSKSLLALYVPRNTRAIPESWALREFVLRALPQHMAPSRFEAVAALPLTPSGKMDRKALSEAVARRDAASKR